MKKNKLLRRKEDKDLKVLVTGAFGNVGLSTINELLRRNHQITIFEIKNKKNKKIAKKYKNKIEIIWGDLRNYKDLEKAILNQDIIIHLAAIIPPLADLKPELAQSVNIEGTAKILNVIKNQGKKPGLIFTSSIAVYGDRRNNPFIKITDSINPSKGDFYALTKIEAEKLIQQSDIKFAIFRLTYITSINKLDMDPLMFRMPLDTCIEICMSKDVGLALANAIECNDIWGEILHIAGGEKCRTTYREYLNNMMKIFGLGKNFLPEEAYAEKDFHCGYLDTKKSQVLLNYQKHTLKDYYNAVREKIGSKRYFMRLIKSFIRIHLLRKSEPYQRFRFFKKKVGAFTVKENKIIRKLISKNYKNIDYLEGKIDKLEKIILNLQKKIEELEYTN